MADPEWWKRPRRNRVLAGGLKESPVPLYGDCQVASSEGIIMQCIANRLFGL